MKKKEEFTGTWFEYMDQLEKELPKNTIDINFSFFKECFEYFILPSKAVKMLVR